MKPQPLPDIDYTFPQCWPELKYIYTTLESMRRNTLCQSGISKRRRGSTDTLCDVLQGGTALLLVKGNINMAMI